MAQPDNATAPLDDKMIDSSNAMTSTDNLTSRQRDVFEFIRGQIRTRGYGPTVREIGEAFDIKSPNGVMCHLKALERKGLIIRSPNKSRAIELSDEFKESQGLPFLGQVSSGLTELDADVGGQLCWEELFPRQTSFALRVTDDSMIESQIKDGDYVIVRKQETANSGDVVVAQTSAGETTLKYWFPEQGRIRLQPGNSSMQAIYVDEAAVMGVVVGVIRTVTSPSN